MKFQTSFYELIPKASIGSVALPSPRKGALLKIYFDDETCGYSDCFCWPELGDLPLEDQLQLLREGKLTDLTSQSLAFARLDAQARKEKVSLWEGLQIPKSHFLLTDVKQLNSHCLRSVAQSGFSTLKVKCGAKIEQDAQILLQWKDLLDDLNLKLRLDFNSSLSFLKANEFLKSLGPVRSSIDFIEDICEYDSRSWYELQDRWQVRLALDRMPNQKNFQPEKGSFSVWILKPAIQNPEWIVLQAQKLETSLVVTSYLGHPWSQLCAAWVAAKLYSHGNSIQVESCGLLSHSVYQNWDTFPLLETNGPELIVPVGLNSGTGLGWDSYWRDIQWS
jgi:o-succinylbenzoate synthase